MAYKHFEAIEKHTGLLAVGIAIMVSLGGLAETAEAVRGPALLILGEAMALAQAGEGLNRFAINEEPRAYGDERVSK